MKKLDLGAAGEHLEYFRVAADVAKKGTCLRAHCGSVIVKDGEIIGEGYNSPPLGLESNRTCLNQYKGVLRPRYDKTCCIHAEWRAVTDACKRNPDKLEGSVLYFMRPAEDGNFTPAGEPYCTTCSRLVLDAGVGTFALWNEDGVYLYDTDEYDRLSYEFFEPVNELKS